LGGGAAVGAGASGTSVETVGVLPAGPREVVAQHQRLEVEIAKRTLARACLDGLVELLLAVRTRDARVTVML